MTPLKLSLIGSTGAVGQEILRLLEARNFPTDTLRCFASPRSLGKTVSFRGQEIPIETLHPGCFKEIDIAFFCAGRKISAEYAPQALQEGALVIDSSSHFRTDPSVPLLIPEINPEAFDTHQGIVSSPNCASTLMLIALAPLHRRCPIKRIVAATYQAASGAGLAAMEELQEETRAYLENRPFTRAVIPHPYAFNLFTHNSPLTETGYVEEEIKMAVETQKILSDPSIQVTATCVRVPVLRAHSLALNVDFTAPLAQELAYEILKTAPGLTLLEDRTNNRFPMPIDASGKDTVYCGRLRTDTTQPNTLEMWVVGDQLLKGAALNAVQIAELSLFKTQTPRISAHALH